MRGEITQVYILNVFMSDEDVLHSYFKCDKMKSSKKKLFDWSHVLFDSYLEQFNRKITNFCIGCKEPDLIKNALVYYDGTKNGDVLSYICQANHYMIGQASSVCMIYGEWSARTPKCKPLKSKMI